MAFQGVTEIPAYAELRSKVWDDITAAKPSSPPVTMKLLGPGMLQALFRAGACWAAAEIRVAPRPGTATLVSQCLQAVQQLCASNAELFSGPAITRFCESFKAWNEFAAPVSLRTGCTDSYAFVDITPLIAPCLCLAPGWWLNLTVDPALDVCLEESMCVEIAPLMTLGLGLSLEAPVAVATRLRCPHWVWDGDRKKLFINDFCSGSGLTAALLIEAPPSWPEPSSITLKVKTPMGRWILVVATEGAIQRCATGFLLHLGSAVVDEDKSRPETKVCTLAHAGTLEDRRRDWFVHRLGLNFSRAQTWDLVLDFPCPAVTVDGCRDPPTVFGLQLNVMRVRGETQGHALSR
jgi:hypothetical protein